MTLGTIDSSTDQLSHIISALVIVGSFILNPICFTGKDSPSEESCKKDFFNFCITWLKINY